MIRQQGRTACRAGAVLRIQAAGGPSASFRFLSGPVPPSSDAWDAPQMSPHLPLPSCKPARRTWCRGSDSCTKQRPASGPSAGENGCVLTAAASKGGIPACRHRSVRPGQSLTEQQVRDCTPDPRQHRRRPRQPSRIAVDHPLILCSFRNFADIAASLTNCSHVAGDGRRRPCALRQRALQPLAERNPTSGERHILQKLRPALLPSPGIGHPKRSLRAGAIRRGSGLRPSPSRPLPARGGTASRQAKNWAPLALIVEPEMKPASSEARKTTQRAISSGSPRRPTGICGMMRSFSTFSSMARTISVPI